MTQQRRRASRRGPETGRMNSSISQGDIRRAVRNFDFVEFLEDRGIEGHENNQNEYRGTCPFCDSGSRDPFCVNTVTGLWFCHHCPEKGGPLHLIGSLLDVGYDKALTHLLDKYRGYEDEDSEEYTEPEVATIKLPAEFRRLAGGTAGLAATPYLKYASKRNLDEALLERYNIGYCASGFYAGRLIVPVYHLGKLVSFVARAISARADAKILTPAGNQQSSYLYNLDNLWGQKEILVVEGVFDALTLPELAVASFGKKISAKQVSLLKKSGVESVTFCYDEDALDELYEFTDKYRFLLRAKLILLPSGKDPSKLGREKMLELLPTAQNIPVGGLRG